VTAPEEQELIRRLLEMEQESIRWTRTNLGQALAISDTMMELAAGAGPMARAVALRVQGTALRLKGRPADGLKAFEEARRLFRQAGEHVQWARTATTAIPAWVQLNRYGEAIRAAEAALKLLEEAGEAAAGARLLNNIASMYGNLGRPAAALRAFTRGEELARATGQPQLEARFSQNRALVLEQLGRYGEALGACVPALRYFLKAGEQVSVARVQQTAAIALFHLGRFGKALRRFATARTAFATHSAPRDVAVCDLYIAACYLELNRYDQTLARVRSVLQTLDPAQDGFQFAWGRLYEGVALTRLGRAGEALEALGAAHRWFVAHGHAAWAGKAKLEEAEAALYARKAGGAVRAARVAARLFAQAHMAAEEARAGLLIAEGCLLTRRLAEAEQAADGALRIFRRCRMPGPTFRALYLLGRIAVQRGAQAEARGHLTRAVRTAERVRSTVQLAFRQAFLDDKSAAYAELVWLELQAGRVSAAHRLADQAKSRALVDTLAAAPGRRPGLTDPRDLALLADIESARRECQALAAPTHLGPELAAALRGGTGSLSAQRTRAEERLAALWDEWELRQTARLGPKAAGRQSGRPAARSRLPEGSCMVEYFLAGRRVIAFVSDGRGLRGWADLGAPDPVRQALELLQLNLDTALAMAQGGHGASPGVLRNAQGLLHDLYQRLWQPLESMLAGRSAVIVVPHGILHLVPFEALFDGRRYLAQRVELALAPSRAAWSRCVERGAEAGAGPDLVLGFNPEGALPYIDEEARAVAALLGTEPHLGREAAGALLPEAVAARRIVHVAAHGEFRQENPFFSTLLLADGPLTAADVAGMHLEAALVVLSGCETGLSRVTRGGELMGLISAFLQAGSASVLASRWRVEDRVTAEFMQRFYSGLLAGRTKAASLREAQAAMANDNVHPLFWAAFGLVGHGGELNG
jgi:tetratricopeptide (TPR) repeat protein